MSIFKEFDGLIFVFDLDQTLVSGYPDIIINQDLAAIIKKAHDSPLVKFMFLLTNNADDYYIRSSIEEIEKLIDRKNIFDKVLSRYSIGRKGERENPTKSVSDVVNMLHDCGVKLADAGWIDAFEKAGVEEPEILTIIRKVVFFDDISNHEMYGEIGKFGHYMVVSPPFAKADIKYPSLIARVDEILTVKPQVGGKKRKQNNTRKFRRANKKYLVRKTR